MLTITINNTLSNTKPRYAQKNLCSSFLQETKDTQISRKPTQLSHNHKDCKNSSKPHTPTPKLVLRLAVVQG